MKYDFSFGAIHEYHGEDEHLVIPDKIEHEKVKCDCGFISMHDIDRVEGIGVLAFGNQLSLKSVVLPAALRYISNHAFIGCENLERVTIPEGVTHIGERAFYDYGKLKSVTIPASVQKIGKKAFGYRTDFFSPQTEGFCICGTAGSEAERYAKENGFAFSEAEETNNPLHDTAKGES